MPVEIRIVPTKRQWDFITCPADIILFGGARGGAKTVGSLLDFWYHAIAHGPNALGLMVRRQRTDLKDTQLAAMNIYGNAAEWKEHGSYFQFMNGARLWFAYLESEKDAMAYQGFSLTCQRPSAASPSASTSDQATEIARPPRYRRGQVPDADDGQPRWPFAFRTEVLFRRQPPRQDRPRSRHQPDALLHSLEDRRQSASPGG